MNSFKQNLDTLNEFGFIIFKNIISKDDIEFARNQITDDQVNYTNMKKFIDNVMFNKTNEQLGWRSKSVKYRVSNNNNSADASLYHRDLICQDPELKLIPSFTCLSYLDTTTMELIPGSHNKLIMNTIDAISIFAKGEKITIYPGDILIFYSTLLHRGIFTENLQNRRLIQIFDMFPNEELYDKYAPSIIHAKGNETSSNIMITISKIGPIINFLNIIGHMNSATGYGWSKDKNILKTCNIKSNIKYISSEGSRGRISGEGIQEFNKYVLLDKTYDFPEECISDYIYVCYSRYYISFFVLLFLFIFMLNKLIKKNNLVIL